MQGDAPAAGMGDYAQGVIEVVGPDIEASLVFYRALGFEVARRTGGFAVLHRQGQRLFVAEDANAPTAPRWISLRLMTSDVDALHDELRDRGVTIVHPLGDRPYGLREFVVRDPNGLDIRFSQPSPSVP
ncbi:MAG TPA: VOC family protein [Lysobacter sp.]|nr:VOC family protein [Lysobacter sp.]